MLPSQVEYIEQVGVREVPCVCSLLAAEARSSFDASNTHSIKSPAAQCTPAACLPAASMQRI